jgi:hypothetical protein
MKCNKCQSPFEITEQDHQFYEKMGVPAPTHCPVCRMKRRLVFRNDRSLYHDESALSGKKMISMYDPKNGYKVYSQDEWWSDQWNPLQYGRDFDFSKPFFEQFAELQKAVPRFNLFNLDTENCEFVNYAPHCKNCYLLFGSWFNEDCYYGQTLNECKNCLDNLFLDKSQWCYENIDCVNNYKSAFCQNSSNATESYFCFDCKNIKNCIGCWNLRNKEYHIANQPVSKEEFEKAKKELSGYSMLEAAKKHFPELIKKRAIHQAVTGLNNEDVSGDFLFDCKNAHHSFSMYRCQDCKFCGRLFDQKDTYDFDGGGKGELVYEAMSNDFAHNSISCTTSEHLSDSHYNDLCFNNENIFGCIGLRYKKYCILNKQYSKEDYEALLPKIIEHMKEAEEWGEFFPANLSPFAYNETQANEYFPMSKEDAVASGYDWKEEVASKTIDRPYQLPESIQDVPDRVVNEVLVCQDCQKSYKIIPQELKFYKTMDLPVPRTCPNCRHKKRLLLRNPRFLYDRKCDKCKKEIRSSYSAEREETVYCENCYLKRLY